MVAFLALGSALLRGLNGGPSVRLLDTNAATALLVLVKRDRARIGIAHEGGWCQSLCQAIQALDAWSVAGFANGVANLARFQALPSDPLAAIPRALLHSGKGARVGIASEGCRSQRGCLASQC